MPATAFVTLEEVKAWKDPAGSISDTSSDENTRMVIEAVCEAMEKHLRRPIVARTKTKESDGGIPKVYLQHVGEDDVLRILKVVESGATLYEAAESDADADTFSSPHHEAYKGAGYVARICNGAFGTWASGPKAVKIAYKTGVAESAEAVPKNLQLAAHVAIKFFLGLGPDDFSKRFDGGSAIVPDDLPKQCKWLMRPYRLPGGAT